MNAKTENHDVMDPAHVFDLASESMDYFAELCEVNGWTFEEDGTMRNAA